jgi:hypothetical protein
MRTSATAMALMIVSASFFFSACQSYVEAPIVDAAPRVSSVNLNFRMRDATVTRPYASVQYEVPAITQSVVNNGAVLAYFREQDTWTALPYTFAYESADFDAVDFTVMFGFAFERRFFELFYEASTTAVNPAAQPDRLVKLVIIDGFPAGKEDIDWTDYEVVARRFNLED